MKLGRLVCLLFFVFGAYVTAFAQRTYLEDADFALYQEEKYHEAIELYKKAYTKENGRDVKAEIIFKIAEAYRLSDQTEQAAVWYDKAILAQYQDPIAYLYLGDMKMELGHYDEAIVHYQKYIAANPSDPRGQLGVESAQKAQKWADDPTKYIVEPVILINSEFYDYSPTFVDRKNEEMIFTSTREGSTGTNISGVTGDNFEDLYFTKRDNKGKWSEPVLVEGVNTEASEGSATMDSRKSVLYFTRCKFEKDGYFGCMIMKSKQQGNSYGEAEKIMIANDSAIVAHPALTPDDKTIVFVSDIDGGYGGKDLWYIKELGRNRWSEPINLGSEINTSGDEMFPTIRDDGTLFFASDGHVGMGGLDIFMASKKGENQWSDVSNMKAPINSNANDFAIIFDGNKDRGYFSSSREGGSGEDDIWEFSQPPILFALQGIVKDLETGEPIIAATVTLTGTDGSTATKETGADGTFEFSTKGTESYIKENTSYSILVSKSGYLNASGKETTVGLTESRRFVHTYELQPITKEAIKLPEILYEFDKTTLTPQAKDSLQYLYDIMVANPNIVIELKANTDSRGSETYNLKLSQGRAESAVEYLISLGIDRERMVPKGYGESNLLISDVEISKLATEEEREAAHQLNRRTEFSILRDDYVPKNEIPDPMDMIEPVEEGGTSTPDGTEITEPVQEGDAVSPNEGSTTQPEMQE